MSIKKIIAREGFVALWVLIISVSIISGCKTVPKNEGKEAKKLYIKI